MNRHRKLAAAVLLLSAATATSASEWTWTVTPYAWATDVGIDVQVDDRQLVDETIPVEDLLRQLDTIAQVRLEGQKGAHGVFADLFDVNLSDDAKTVPLPGGDGTATFAPEMGMTILDLGGLYDPRGDQQGFELLYGARLLDERATIAARATFPNGTVKSRDVDVDDRFVDALVGIRFARRIGERFSFQTQADVSKGGTDYTWSLGPTFGYTFGRTSKYTAIAGYRRMVVKFKTDAKVDATMTLSGFLAGLRIAF